MVRIFYTEVKRDGESAKAAGLHRAAHEMLRQCVLSCMTGITGRSPRAVRMELGYGPHGKPYLKSHPAFNVSLSHAGNIALCAISENEIGADVQDHRAMTGDRVMQIANRFFAPSEQQLLSEEADAEVQKERFFRIWSAKEAYAKLTGKGLAEDFSHFAVDPARMRVLSVTEDIKKTRVLAHLCEPFALAGYSIMLCTEEPVPSAETARLELDRTFTATLPGETTAEEALAAMQKRSGRS